MAIYTRSEFLGSYNEDAWLGFERAAGREWPIVVDVLNGNKEDHLDWLDSMEIDPETYSAHGAFVFFQNADAATMFYLRWGVHGNP